LAWGGTNMHSMSSDLVEVESAEIKKVEAVISRHWWFDKKVSISQTEFGRLVSEIPFLEDNLKGRKLALRWIGHQSSNEIGSFLKVLYAKNVKEFHEAFSDYAVSGQNMLAADVDGNIIHTLAVRLPDRAGISRQHPWYSEAEHLQHWSKMRSNLELGSELNPEKGFLTSANSRPRFTENFLSFAYSGEERIHRLDKLLSESGKVSLQHLKEMQMDVYSEISFTLSRQLLELVQQHALLDSENADLVKELENWNGQYKKESRGALVFELLLAEVFSGLYPEEAWQSKSGLAERWAMLSHFLVKDIRQLESSRARLILFEALKQAQAKAIKFKSWGDVHKIRVGYPLQSVPVIGRFFKMDSFAVDGSRETLMKTAHGLVNSPHYASYGSQSRHISDMSDLDANYFVLFGGQDGWLGSQNFYDQVELWQNGKYLQLPLSLEKREAEFNHLSIVLSP